MSLFFIMIIYVTFFVGIIRHGCLMERQTLIFNFSRNSDCLLPSRQKHGSLSPEKREIALIEKVKFSFLIMSRLLRYCEETAAGGIY